MDDNDDDLSVSRRTLLHASAGTASLSAVGSARADDGGGDGNGEGVPWLDQNCPEATVEPGMEPCEGGSAEGCADDHPATIELRSAVEESLEAGFSDVDALIDAGFKPYFDALEVGDDSWSHWLHPEFIGDDGLVDPERPESVLVDNESWRSMGVMFIATRGGEPVEPPAVYGADDTEEQCSPWHTHTGLPGRFAWWYYQQVYGHAADDLEFPCRTPCMLHVWTVDHPETVYAHDAPPQENRELSPASDPSFETDAAPGEDELGWDVLPNDLVPDQRPEERIPVDL
ncbi:hypothetical protein E2L06_03535 [Haloterrigena sp. H1]|uniref:hypothetical protein n=1 Tax=Haloterrigena sp. H1 TaxID=2552943 RepID=UPI00110E76A4|nr:hypothetical protein [Haloterrigena sp. H1]TMT85713.1 hypothetical protein E2L06_03535 [Haloterrigena sp. H1]